MVHDWWKKWDARCRLIFFVEWPAMPTTLKYAQICCEFVKLLLIARVSATPFQDLFFDHSLCVNLSYWIDSGLLRIFLALQLCVCVCVVPLLAVSPECYMQIGVVLSSSPFSCSLFTSYPTFSIVLWCWLHETSSPCIAAAASHYPVFFTVLLSLIPRTWRAVVLGLLVMLVDQNIIA